MVEHPPDDLLAARRATPDPAHPDRFGQIEQALSVGIGTRLRQAREEAGMSQQELGGLLGYTPAMVSAFENGRRRMKLEDLARVCIALGKEPDYFLQTSGRRAVSVGVGMALRAEVARLPQEDLARSIEAFLDDVDRDFPPTAVVPDLRHLRPDAAAREVLDRSGFTTPPVHMEEVCQALWVPLYRADFPDALSALVVEVSAGVFVIGVNAGHSDKRRRFSAAHELGHAVLRHEASYYLEYASEDAGEPPGYRYLDEREANAFAASLLMDERWLRQDFAGGIRDVQTLAARYHVSDAAMGFRLVNLGLT